MGASMACKHVMIELARIDAQWVACARMNNEKHRKKTSEDKHGRMDAVSRLRKVRMRRCSPLLFRTDMLRRHGAVINRPILMNQEGEVADSKSAMTHECTQSGHRVVSL